MINLSDTLISDLYVGTSQVSAAFLGDTQVYPNGPVYPIMGTFQASQSALMPTTSTPYIVDTNLNTINVTTNNNDFYVETIPSGTTQLLIGGERITQQAYSPIRTITRCEFTPTSCGSMFTNMPYVTQINLSRLNTSNATSTSGMFKGCSRLTSLIISNLDTSRVFDMSEMFYGCTNLQSLDLSSFHTGSVTDMTAMFDICSSLSFINLSTIRTPNVTIMDRMFNDCSSLTSLDLSHFDTSNVTQMNAMFRNCSSLTSLDLSNFDTTSVVMFGSMFEGCSSLTSLNLSNFTTQSAASQLYLSNMFLNVPSNCVITMNNVTNATFDDLTDYNTTGLDTSIIIFRDGAIYEYDSTQDKWIISQQQNKISGTTSSANRTYTNALRINGVYHDVVTDANGDFTCELANDEFAYPGNGASYGDLLSGNSDFRTQLLSIDFTNMQYAQYVDLSNMFCWSPTPNLQHVYFDFSKAVQSSFACGGGFLRQLPANSRVHGLGTLRWSDTIHTDSNFISGYACMSFREFAQNTIVGTFDIRGIDTTRITDQSYSGLPQAYNPSSFQGPYYNFIQRARFDTLIIGNYEVQNTNISGSYLNNITTLYCTSQTPPSLNRTGANGLVAQNYVSKLTGLQNIYVPTGCLSVYQNAPIWSQYANLMSELDAPNPLTI